MSLVAALVRLATLFASQDISFAPAINTSVANRLAIIPAWSTDCAIIPLLGESGSRRAVLPVWLGWEGDDKLIQSHGLALHKHGASNKKFFISSHFGLDFLESFALLLHLSTKNKLLVSTQSIQFGTAPSEGSTLPGSQEKCIQ